MIFGIDRQADTLGSRPRVPASWVESKLHYRYYQTFCHVEFSQVREHRGPVRMTLDGQLQAERLKLVNDEHDHAVEVVVGPCEAEPAVAKE